MTLIGGKDASLKITLLHSDMTVEALGFIPGMLLSAPETATAVQALDAGYQHAGGWDHFDGFRLNTDDSISYPGDPAHKPLAEIIRGDERILIYPYSWVAVIQPDRSFEICRMD